MHVNIIIFGLICYKIDIIIIRIKINIKIVEMSKGKVKLIEQNEEKSIYMVNDS